MPVKPMVLGAAGRAASIQEKSRRRRRGAECHEEIGLVPDTIVRLGALPPTPGYCDEEMIFFRLSGLRPPNEPAEVDEDEDIEPRTFTLAEARDDGQARARSST